MKKLVLDRLIEEVRAPGVRALAELGRVELMLLEARRDNERKTSEIKDLHKCQLPFSDLARAAKAMLDAKTPNARREARADLRKRLDAASEHIDWIPF